MAERPKIYAEVFRRLSSLGFGEVLFETEVSPAFLHGTAKRIGIRISVAKAIRAGIAGIEIRRKARRIKAPIGNFYSSQSIINASKKLKETKYATLPAASGHPD